MGDCKSIINNLEVKDFEAKIIVNGLIEIKKQWHEQNPSIEVEFEFGYGQIIDYSRV